MEKYSSHVYKLNNQAASLHHWKNFRLKELENFIFKVEV